MIRLLIGLSLLSSNVQAEILTETQTAKILTLAGIHERLVPVFVCIAKYESSFNTKALNTNNPNGTKDIGLFQINSESVKLCQMRETDLYNPVKNAACAHTIMLAQGLNAWVAWRKNKRECNDAIIDSDFTIISNKGIM